MSGDTERAQRLRQNPAGSVVVMLGRTFPGGTAGKYLHQQGEHSESQASRRGAMGLCIEHGFRHPYLASAEAFTLQMQMAPYPPSTSAVESLCSWSLRELPNFA